MTAAMAKKDISNSTVVTIQLLRNMEGCPENDTGYLVIKPADGDTKKIITSFFLSIARGEDIYCSAIKKILCMNHGTSKIESILLIAIRDDCILLPMPIVTRDQDKIKIFTMVNGSQQGITFILDMK